MTNQCFFPFFNIFLLKFENSISTKFNCKNKLLNNIKNSYNSFPHSSNINLWLLKKVSLLKFFAFIKFPKSSYVNTIKTRGIKIPSFSTWIKIPSRKPARNSEPISKIPPARQCSFENTAERFHEIYPAR
jgi:hypothetical protein